MGDIFVSLALVLLFVLIGGFFAASELAVVSLRDSQVERMAQTGRRGRGVARLYTDQNRFLSSVQVGVTLSGFFASAYGGSTLAGPLAGVLAGWGAPAAGTIALIAVTAFVSYLSLVLGELVPKRLALQKSEAVALFVAPVLNFVARISRPVIWLLSASTNVIVRLIGLDPRGRREEVSEEELRDMVAANQALGVEERQVLGDVFSAADRQVAEVMVPRTEVEFLSAATPLREAARQVLGKPHSRYPVIGDTVDDIVGILHVRDLLTALVTGDDDAERRTAGRLARPVPLVPNSKPILIALSEMRAGRSHLAVVVDEYGGTAGIVTIEDILEEIVGEIEDEYDPRRAVVDIRDLDGLLHRDQIAERTGITLPDGPYETLGGFVQFRLGRVPQVGDSFEAFGHRFTVAEMDGRRVARIHVSPAAPADAEVPGSIRQA